MRVRVYPYLMALAQELIPGRGFWSAQLWSVWTSGEESSLGTSALRPGFVPLGCWAPLHKLGFTVLCCWGPLQKIDGGRCVGPGAPMLGKGHSSYYNGQTDALITTGQYMSAAGLHSRST